MEYENNYKYLQENSYILPIHNLNITEKISDIIRFSKLEKVKIDNVKAINEIKFDNKINNYSQNTIIIILIVFIVIVSIYLYKNKNLIKLKFNSPESRLKEGGVTYSTNKDDIVLNI